MARGHTEEPHDKIGNNHHEMVVERKVLLRTEQTLLMNKEQKSHLVDPVT